MFQEKSFFLLNVERSGASCPGRASVGQEPAAALRGQVPGLEEGDPAAAAGAGGAVVAALAGVDAGACREVAEQAGEEQGQQGHGGPAGAAVRLGAGEGFVGARVLVVRRAVVEQAFDAAHTRPVLHRALSGAHAPAPTQPAERQHPWAHALGAAAAPALLAAVPVFMEAVVTPAEGLRQRLQLLRTGLWAFGLDSDDLCPGLS